MQWDITQLGSTRRATAKARTQPLRIYHVNERPLRRGAMQEYIKLKHNSRSLLQVFFPQTLCSYRTMVWQATVSMIFFSLFVSLSEDFVQLRELSRGDVTMKQ